MESACCQKFPSLFRHLVSPVAMTAYFPKLYLGAGVGSNPRMHARSVGKYSWLVTSLSGGSLRVAGELGFLQIALRAS